MTGETLHFDRAELPPEAQALRGEVRCFLDEQRDAGTFAPSVQGALRFSPEFSRALGARGWIGMTWPEIYGGRARSPLERYVVTEEMLPRARRRGHIGSPTASRARSSCALAPRISAANFCRGSRAATAISASA